MIYINPKNEDQAVVLDNICFIEIDEIDNVAICFHTSSKTHSWYFDTEEEAKSVLFDIYVKMANQENL